MSFINFSFFIFLIATVIVFYICPVKFRWIILLASSIVFYCIAGIEYLPFILITSFTVFLASRKMGKIYEKMEADIAQEGLDRKEKKKIKDIAKKACFKFLIATLILNVGILIIVKFTKFAVDPINSLLLSLGQEGKFSAAYIIVPLGISYYTFSCLSYLLDVYWKRIKHEDN